MNVVSEPESDNELLRKFFAIQETTTYSIASRRYSDSKLLAAKLADPTTFSRWMEEARAWRAEERLSYH